MTNYLNNLTEIFRLLMRPLVYLRIKNSRKNRIDTWIPLIFTIFLEPELLYFNKLNIFSEYGLVHGMSGLLQILAGFFITALAAVSTFPGSPAYPMEETLSGEGVYLVHSEDDIEELTRRRFLCLLFGYLGVVSIFLYLSGSLVMMIAPTLHNFIRDSHPHTSIVLKGLFLMIYIPTLSHMFASTLLGLVFRSDRIPNGAGIKPTLLDDGD